MAELKTKPNEKSVEQFLRSIPDEQKSKDAFALQKLLEQVTKQPPKMWGDSIIGFGEYTYQNCSAKELTWFPLGFSPRKQNLTIYLLSGFEGLEPWLSKLGKYKTGKCCLYVKQLADIDLKVLKAMMKESQKLLKRWMKDRST